VIDAHFKEYGKVDVGDTLKKHWNIQTTDVNR